ncbi:reverse transcriptase family protein [Naasia sp. SYSU D00948]|uniref:reverse transcriptase family protein n=1 Tax=Naasia sp. SYSU D00948 TaxID=2817379 RepID=UPI001B30B5D1|nr:reverse transcriptase family protein [Naasia sp. SYSU D00948]
MNISRRALAARLLVSNRYLDEAASRVTVGDAYILLSLHRRRGETPRQIFVPDAATAFLVKKFHEWITSVGPRPPDHVYGFVRGRSPLENARQHLAKQAVLRIDLRDFFPSISAQKVREALLSVGLDASAAEVATRILTVNDQLPTGFASSPALSNLVFRDSDIAISSWAKDHGLTFTRYVDDLVFSGEIGTEAVSAAVAMVEKTGWRVNTDKTRLMKRGGKQYVTGLAVSDPVRPRIPPSRKRSMRMKLHLIERFGYERYMREFQGEERGDTPGHLRGTARYMAGIEQPFGSNLLARLNAVLPEYWSMEDRSDPDWLEWLGDFH